jgi:hypothetical protein
MGTGRSSWPRWPGRRAYPACAQITFRWWVGLGSHASREVRVAPVDEKSAPSTRPLAWKLWRNIPFPPPKVRSQSYLVLACGASDGMCSGPSAGSNSGSFFPT